MRKEKTTLVRRSNKITKKAIIQFMNFCCELLNINTPAIKIHFEIKDNVLGSYEVQREPGRSLKNAITIHVANKETWNKPIMTVFHECRHVWQRKHVNEYLINAIMNKPDNILKREDYNYIKWFAESEETEYCKTPCEIDAELFARLIYAWIFDVQVAMPPVFDDQTAIIANHYLNQWIAQKEIQEKVESLICKYHIREYENVFSERDIYIRSIDCS